jgi:hypothetical protein
VLRAMSLRMSTKFSFSDEDANGMTACPGKDRPPWPLPDTELARTYIDGTSFSEDSKRPK